MLNGKLCSSKEIILKIIRDNGYQVQDFTYSDIIEWLGECLDLIGCAYSLRKNIACIKIKDHRGILPCDFHTPIQASAFNCQTGIQIPMRTATSSFHPLFFQNPNNVGIVDPNQPISFDGQGNPIFNFMNFDEAVSKQIVSSFGSSDKDVTYELNDNYIFTTFKDGASVLFAYYGFPVDSEGFPMIPDNSKFKEACAAFVRSKIDYKLYRTGKLSKPLFDWAEQQRDWYIGAATIAGMMPSVDTMESYKNQLCRLIPRYTEHSKNFETLGDQEELTFSNMFFRF